MPLLIIDDSEDSRALLKAYLQSMAPLIEEAGSGEEALRHIQGAPAPDLILLDLNMPGMDGLEVCRRLKSMEAIARTPVLMITASSSVADVEAAFGAGASDYISKPVREAELRARAGSLLRLKMETDIRLARESELLKIKGELERANATLKELSVKDALTGLANRRAFNERLELEWNRSLRSGSTLGLVICDVDHFKAYNDVLGHPAGDVCLQSVTSALPSALRPMDLVARIGGEEFAAILPGAGPAECLEVGERLCKAVAALHLPHPKDDWGSVSISAGVAALKPSEDTHRSTLFELADAALYRAKHSGRRRVMP